MSFKQFLSPLAIVLAVILGALFGVADWYKDSIKEERAAIQQPITGEKNNEQKENPKATLIFLEGPNKIHLLKEESKDSIISISLAPITNIEKISIVNNILYFVGKDESEKRFLKSLDLTNLDESIKSLDFIDTYHLDFLISPDNEKIAWVVLEPIEYTDEKPRQEIHSNKIFSADLGGENKKIVFREENFEAIYPFLIYWSKSDKIYFVDHYDGVGGYYPAVDIVAYQIREVDINTKEIIPLVNVEKYRQRIYSVRISPQENFIAYIVGSNLVVRNLRDGSEEVGPIDRKFAYSGGLFFSPDEKFIVYNSARGDPDNEEFTITIVDLSTLEKKEILKGLYCPTGWLNEERLIIQDSARKTYFINKDGTGLRKISDFVFVGVVE